jgi:uncharacterized protein with HEPN domain
MPHDPRVLLHDVRTAAEHVLGFVAGRTFDDYRADPLLRSAVERQFIVIGEALTRFDRSDPTLAAKITDCGRIIAFRNILVHGYEVIDDAIVWQVILSGIPVLRSEVDHLFDSIGGAP